MDSNVKSVEVWYAPELPLAVAQQITRLISERFGEDSSFTVGLPPGIGKVGLLITMSSELDPEIREAMSQEIEAIIAPNARRVVLDLDDPNEIS